MSCWVAVQIDKLFIFQASISAFRVFQLTEVTTFMVIVEGNSKPQNQAIALAIEVRISAYYWYFNALFLTLYLKDDVKIDFNGQLPISKEGSASSGWILLDYGNPSLRCRFWYFQNNKNALIKFRQTGSVIVHVMTPQMRNFYKIERRWKDAEVLLCSIFNIFEYISYVNAVCFNSFWMFLILWARKMRRIVRMMPRRTWRICLTRTGTRRTKMTASKEMTSRETKRIPFGSNASLNHPNTAIVYTNDFTTFRKQI